MSTVKVKRNSLELYLKEQIIGPGAGRNRVIRINKDNFSFLEKPYLENNNEALTKVPGFYYSTGILFPNKSYEITQIVNSSKKDILEEDYDIQDEQLENNTIEEENLISEDEAQIDQMYPKNMGLTFCIKLEDLKSKGFELHLSARHYRRVDDKEQDNFGIRLELDKDKFNNILELKLDSKITLGQFFKVNTLNNISYLKQFNNFPQELIKGIDGNPILDSKGKEKYKQINILTLAKNIIGESFYNQNTNLFKNIGQNFKKNIDNLITDLSDQILKSCTDENLRILLYNASQVLEEYQNILSHFSDANVLYTGTYGVWEASLLKKILYINQIKLGGSIKTILKNDELLDTKILDENNEVINTLSDVLKVDLDNNKKAALSLNIQFSCDTRANNNDLVYCKIQIYNTSSPFTATETNFYSMASEELNVLSFFGVECKVKYDLYPYNDRDSDIAVEDNEASAIRLLYRNINDYAVGHGCSVSWDIAKSFVKTDYMPHCDTPDVDSTPRDITQTPINGTLPNFSQNTTIQQIKYLSTLSDASDDEIILGLNNFMEDYNLWILKKSEIVEGIIDANELLVARSEMNKCINDYKRLKYNINTFLMSGSDNLKKFRLMNTAMFIQMWHKKYAGTIEINELMNSINFSGFNADFYKKCKDDIYDLGISANWRAFQLAFIILNLDGIFNDTPDNPQRNDLVDLVWFPTGGGKTEAYFGLICLTILHRRMTYFEEGGGTSAIMRYTLRLLTLQQFQRASILIMALEIMRRCSISFGQDLGIEPIRIGLYVGNNQIPNKTNDTVKGGLIQEFQKMNNNKSSKIPFDNCICCGSKIRGLEVVLNQTNNNFNHDIGRLFCTNKLCAMYIPVGSQVKQRPDMGFFPFLLSDEAIYQHPPALLFGTVDKFAQLAHKVNNANNGRNEDSRRLFGRGNWEGYKPKEGYLPPDLIIQDELHLLLGPLGTGVALFESAFEQLCTRKNGTKPKVISSTATTRNTGLQIEALFNKNLNIFPKAGIDCDDSFFGMYKRLYNSENSNYVYESKRRYIGFLPTGRTQVWMQMRIDALCLAHRALFELEFHNNDTINPNFSYDLEKAQNYYYSIVAYFNSVKEVGRTQAQVQTYILRETRKLLNRSMRSQKLLKPIYAMKSDLVESELTGRKSGEEVKKELARVSSNWSPNRFPIKIMHEDGQIEIMRQDNIIPEFVVATNMISVGLDVGRFNVIIMNSMPRNTAEYIQASSRVARNDFGLVLTIHHPFKARDLSHYEKFIEFHEKMYSYVEPISITPFTKKSIDRFMPLYIATIVRHFNEKFANRNSANNIEQNDIDSLTEICMKYFNKRERRLSSKTDDAIKELLTGVDLEYINTWVYEAITSWFLGKNQVNGNGLNMVFKNAVNSNNQIDLFSSSNNLNIKDFQIKWKVAMSLRNIEPSAAIHVNKY